MLKGVIDHPENVRLLAFSLISCFLPVQQYKQRTCTRTVRIWSSICVVAVLQ